MRPTLVVNPTDDRDFADAAEAAVDDGADSTATLERHLRAAYPLATVHARELAGEPTTIWYVYREGRWVPSRSRRGGEEG